MLLSRRSARSVLALSLFLLLDSSLVRAEPAPRRLSVLNAAAPGIEPGRLATVDMALRDALSMRPEFALVQTSAVPYEDVELAAGCGPEQSNCLQLIANQLGTDALLVRRVARLSDATATLTLVVAEAPAQGGATRQAAAELAWADPQAAEHAVQQLLGQLFPRAPELTPESVPVAAVAEPAPSEPSSLSSQSDSERPRWRRRFGVTVTALGVAVLAAGLTTGILSRHAERQYARSTTRNVQEVDHAHELFLHAERRARIANGMLGAGAIITVLGVATIVGDWVALRSSKGSAELSLQPTRAGMMLSLSGSWSGGT